MERCTSPTYGTSASVPLIRLRDSCARLRVTERVPSAATTARQAWPIWATRTTSQWIRSPLGIPPWEEARGLIVGLHAIAVIGLAAVPLNYLILKRLLAIVDTVRAGDPFVAVNAQRLQTIAWTLLTLQLLSIVIGTIATAVSTPAHPVRVSAGFSINGWLAVLLTFLLARVFAAGTEMRDDLAGMV